MRILQAHGNGEKSGDNPISNVQQHEFSANGDVANSTERDAADMRKLGVHQETKVGFQYTKLRQFGVIDVL